MFIWRMAHHVSLKQRSRVKNFIAKADKQESGIQHPESTQKGGFSDWITRPVTAASCEKLEIAVAN